MTTRARKVLANCEYALADFLASAGTPYVQSRWVSVITQLRTVLDALTKVDGPAATPEVRQRIAAARKKLFESKPEPRIFHEFIEDERNDTVHEYDLCAMANPKIHGAWTLQGEPIYASHRPGVVTTAAFSMSDGPYKGRDPRQLAREAIAFWRSYLDAIDSGSGTNENRLPPPSSPAAS